MQAFLPGLWFLGMQAVACTTQGTTASALTLPACRDVVARYHPRALRWFLVNTQYRQPINYTQRALEEASAGSTWCSLLC